MIILYANTIEQDILHFTIYSLPVSHEIFSLFKEGGIYSQHL